MVRKPLPRRQSCERRRLAAVVVVILASAVSGLGGDVPDDAIRFNREIRPLLSDNCFACHGADSAARQAELRLDQRDAAIEAGAITAGDPEASELIARIFTDDPELVMPPGEAKKHLSDDQRQLLKRWIAAGAAYEPHWSFVAPHTRPTPQPQNEAWVKTTIDRFVLTKLEASGLTPAPDADARTLFRRIHLDITGLPPRPEDVAAFARDYAEGQERALSDWIDRLMDSPAWGEHRARYWLDAARYGDTHGMHFDNYREIWPYRDWVIRAFNANQPFDQFTVEQLAGDLLPNPTDEQVIATGFQRCNITTNEGGTIDEENLANYAVDRVQTFGWVFLGLTTNCSQCHDHKFDPFTMRDYYSLAAFFRNTTQGAKDGNSKDGRGPVLAVPIAEDQPRWQELAEAISAAQAERDRRRQDAVGEFEAWLAVASPESVALEIPTEGLLIQAPLNEGAGNRVLSTCAATQSIQATGDIQWTVDGRLGPAPLMRPGATFHLGTLGEFDLHQEFSYGAWIKAGRNDASGAIIAKMDEQAGYRGWDLWQNGRSLAVHLIDTWPNNALKVITRREVVDTNAWQHVFVTYDGSAKPSGIKIYVNGIEERLNVETDALGPDASIHTTTALRIGQRSHANVFEGGTVQDARIYDRSLTASDVKAIANLYPISYLLGTTPQDRQAAQQADLFDYFLTQHDAHYPLLSRRINELETEREAILARSPVTHIQQERRNSPAMAHILLRGAYDKPGEQVAAATPAALPAMRAGAPRNRLGLAEWLVDPAHPLTARVTVNRFWQELFGQGIVVTPEDFGVTGTQPSHPELLDWMAIEFRESGWDVKALFKRMLMSHTYRQAATTTPLKLEKDPDNVLLSRGPRFRMDAEMVRDYALAASGLLSPKMYGPSVRPYQPEGVWDVVGVPGGDTRDFVQDTGEDLYRRTLYTFWKRMAPPPNMEAFNAPSREVCTVRRERTNTPLQALVTLNDPQFVEAARVLAQEALNASGDDELATVDFIARRVICRPMTDDEQSIVLGTANDLRAHYDGNADQARALIAVGESQADKRLGLSSLAAWTMVCNQLMNLDEALTK